VTKSQFTQSQIAAILKEADAGMKLKGICRKYGIGGSIYYSWKAKYGGVSVSELKRMKELEAENTWLKRMYADLVLENRAEVYNDQRYHNARGKLLSPVCLCGEKYRIRCFITV